ncbi:hypothetical protein LXL04_004535 [Taraxacum kok-saghyz]
MCTSRSSSTQKNPISNWKHNRRFIGDCRLYHRTMRRRPGIGGLQTIAAARVRTNFASPVGIHYPVAFSVEISACLESLQPFHTATASALRFFSLNDIHLFDFLRRSEDEGGECSEAYCRCTAATVPSTCETSNLNHKLKPCLRASTGFLSHGCMTHTCTAVPLLEALLRWRETDLSRNYLNGTIRPQWAPMRLGDLSIEGNRFSGSIPQEIVNMKNLQKLILVSNEFSGQLPDGLGKLTNLTDMRLSDNNFTGKIPDYISNWTQIEKLHMCYLEGPIPSSISLLTKLNELRISDLKGTGSSFPRLQKMDNLSKL